MLKFNDSSAAWIRYKDLKCVGVDVGVGFGVGVGVAVGVSMELPHVVSK
jgi:hypothetical protein